MNDIEALYQQALAILAGKKRPAPIEYAGPCGIRLQQPARIPTDLEYLRQEDPVLTFHLYQAGLFEDGALIRRDEGKGRAR
ncbi:hypothetical protein [Paraburkholderia diazotrophica]|uniref:hypothetical protein n=1 Tax=Paraburkholderia diazotrophica TaxID=667676 RepID=UPI00316C81D3